MIEGAFSKVEYIHSIQTALHQQNCKTLLLITCSIPDDICQAKSMPGTLRQVVKMKYISTYTWVWCGPLSQYPLPPARHQPHLLIPSAQTTNQKKAKNPEMRFNSQQIVSYCLGLRTQNPGLREVDLEPSPKRGSDKINMLK